MEPQYDCTNPYQRNMFLGDVKIDDDDKCPFKRFHINQTHNSLLLQTCDNCSRGMVVSFSDSVNTIEVEIYSFDPLFNGCLFLTSDNYSITFDKNVINYKIENDSGISLHIPYYKDLTSSEAKTRTVSIRNIIFR